MKNKLVSMLLSVAIALGIWMYVITVEKPGSTDTIYNIPVVLEGETVLNERGLIVTSTGTMDVDLTLTGNRSDLRQVDSSNITIKVDLSRVYDPGKHELEYSISYPGTVARNAFTEEKRNPSRIQVTIEERAKREIPVVVSYTGKLPEDDFFCDRGNVVLDYTAITVSGPKSVVNRIASAEVTVDLTDRTESISESYRFTLRDVYGEPVDAKLITVNTEEVHVDLKIQRMKFIQLAVTLENGGGATDKYVSCEIKPGRIQVSGSEAALKSLGDVINLGTIKLAEYPNDAVIKLPFILPETVTNHSNINEATVDLKFVGLATKEITIGDMELINLPENLEAELITEVVTVTFRGPATDIAKLTSEAVDVKVDLSAAQVGTATYKVTVTVDPKFGTLGTVGTYSVTVTVQEK